MNETAAAIHATLTSPAEMDRNLETANAVDGLFALARAARYQGEGLSAIAQAVEDSGNAIGSAIRELAAAIREHS